MDPYGNPIEKDDRAVDKSDYSRNKYFQNSLLSTGAFKAVLTGDPARYGYGPLPAYLQNPHGSHQHFQQHYPKYPAETTITPGQR